MWKVWDKVSNINNFSPEEFLKINHHLQSQEGVIYIKEVDGKIVQVESKAILAKIYNLNENSSDEEFLASYDAKLQELNSRIVDLKTFSGNI